ncbi:ABC transporter substrate-binding protein [Leptolyngbya sp. FACHB-261]|uniref:ABC transporter substrate-binding protein n=1 Tax=Leptolyngbya sp. FACHB-261 TaxID=2692806 RepID=UPI001689249A|nr:ABC transporter substrate-binding protein [Leptolyngbya sp. FACHB-261]MBD2102939.1 ABC transporter substrate-binding protein [Leptolyngbya sp. FACHB-261]
MQRLFPAVQRLLVLVLVLVVTGLLGACSASPAAPPPQLLLSSISDPKTFNCVIANDSASTEACGYLYEGLISKNGITQEFEGSLAESWQVLDDGQRIVFKLRRGLKWSDGQPLTTNDVVFTFNDLYFDERIPAPIRDILRIGDAGVLPEVRKLDDLRVEFKLPEPFSPFLEAVGAAIFPEHILRSTLTPKTAEQPPPFVNSWGVDSDVTKIVGSGLYRMTEYRPAERIAFESNPHYRLAGKPYIERIILNIVDSQDTALLQFRSRDLDMLSLRPEDFELLKREEKRDKFDIYNGGPAPSTFFITFNQSQGKNSKNNKPFVNPIRSKWFNDIAFRRAVAYAINRSEMINNVFRGLGEPQNSPIIVQSPYYLPPDKGLKTYDYDLEKAKAILVEAGYRYNAQGQLLDAEGNAVRFTLSTNAGNKVREATGTQIKSDLAKIGIQVDFVPLQFTLLVSKLKSTRDWEAIILSFGGGGTEPNNGSNIWRSTGSLHAFNQGPQPGEPPLPGRVVTDWEKKIDQLLLAGTQEFDVEKRKVIYNEFQQIVQEQLPLIYLVNPLSLSAARSRVEGIQIGALGSLLWNLEDLRLSD